MPSLPARPVEILLVEELEPDVLLTRLSLQQSMTRSNLQVVWDGQEALDLLHRQPPFEQAATPDLILLNLRLPRMDGLQLIDSLQLEPDFKGLPLVILTTGQEDLRLIESRQDRVLCCLEKPLDTARIDSAYFQLYGLLSQRMN